MRKITKIGLAVGVLGAACALGPRVGPGPVDTARARAAVPARPDELDAWLSAKEAAVPDIRPGDASALSWVTPGAPTPLSLVYLHGYSASPEEIEPVTQQVGARLGANGYRPRLRGHGQTPAAMADVPAGAWTEDVAQALEVGARIGDRTVLIGTSTGGTLAALAALEHPDLAGLVLLAPNFGPQDPAADLLLMPWLGLLLPPLMADNCWTPRNPAQGAHWTTCTPITSVAAMMVVVKQARDADWSRLQVPVLVLRSDDDTVVDQPAIDAWLAALSVPTKRVLVSAQGDESGHVLAGDITAPSKTSLAVDTISAWIAALPAGR